MRLTLKQKKIIHEWFGTARYVYNKALNFVENDKPEDYVVTKINLRNKFVTHKTRQADPLYEQYQNIVKEIKNLQKISKVSSGDTLLDINKKISALQNEKLETNSRITMTINRNVNDWELNTPKEIRANIIDDLIVARKAAFTNLNNGNIKFFKMNYRSKKNISQTITIPKSAFNFRLKKKKSKRIKNRIGIYVKKLGHIKTNGKFPKKCDYDMKINRYNGNYYLCLPYSKRIDKSIPKYESCSLDPGARTMHVLYSEHEVLKIQQDNELIKKLNNKIDTMTSLRTKAKNMKHRFHSFDKRIKNLREKLRNLIDDMHYKFINYLTSTYQKIYLPSFESQEMMRNNRTLSSSTKRTLNILSHFKFKQRLQSKAKTKSHCEVYIVNEDYTTKTCTNCGNLNNVQSEKEIVCNSCDLKIDRDINGARNIFIKIEHNNITD